MLYWLVMDQGARKVIRHNGHIHNFMKKQEGMMIDVAKIYAIKEFFGALRGVIPHMGKEDPLEQQVPSGLLPGYDDDAVMAALDATLVKERGQEYLNRITAVRAKLEPHQRSRWRKVYTTIKLTERHEDVLCSRKRTKVEASPKGPAREDSTEEYQRLQRDYEYTLEDPRLQHLILVSEMVRDQGVEAAVEYLIASDFALEKSVTQQATEKLSELKKAGGEKLRRGAYRLFLGDEYEKIFEQNPGKPMEELEKIFESALVAKTAREEEALEQARRDRILHARPLMLGITIAMAAVMIAAIGLIQFLR